MGERPTLILTTRVGVRPLGVRGDPLHAVAGQLLAVIRRRLGDGPANLLAEPQLRETGDGIDWYAAQSDGGTGEVRRFSELGEAERSETLRTVESRLEGIRDLGSQLEASNTSDEARLIGRSLQLATRRPSDDFIFLVDGQPVIVAWGYEADAAAGLQGFVPPQVPALARPAAVLASAPALPAGLGWSRWLGALLFGLLLLLLLLLTSWLLRACSPVDPSLNVAEDHLHGVAPAPPHSGAQRDRRRDGRKERLRVTERVVRDVPGEAGGRRGLHDRPPRIAQAPEGRIDHVAVHTLQYARRAPRLLLRPRFPLLVPRRRPSPRCRRPRHRRLNRRNSRPRRRRSTGRRPACCRATGRAIPAVRA